MVILLAILIAGVIWIVTLYQKDEANEARVPTVVLPLPVGPVTSPDENEKLIFSVAFSLDGKTLRVENS